VLDGLEANLMKLVGSGFDLIDFGGGEFIVGRLVPIDLFACMPDETELLYFFLPITARVGRYPPNDEPPELCEELELPKPPRLTPELEDELELEEPER
jgi:hypothetical protein